MIIADVFEHKNRTAVYIILEKEDVPNSIFNMILDSKTYDVIEYDVMISITGYRSIVVLVDTKDEIKIGQSVVLT